MHGSGIVWIKGWWWQVALFTNMKWGLGFGSKNLKLSVPASFESAASSSNGGQWGGRWYCPVDMMVVAVGGFIFKT